MNVAAGESVVALLTPPGRGGVAVLGLAGEGAPRVLERAFAGRALPEVHGLARGELRDAAGAVDEVLVARPDESRWEIGCHGGPGVARRALAALVACGAREVEAEELERAARPEQDATRVEARERLALAPTELAARALALQAAGALGERLSELRATLAVGAGVAGLQKVQDSLAALEATVRFGLACTAPPAVALVGSPNAGKSTLFNALLGRERAIVAPEPGTTRDVLEETVSLEGVPVLLQDLAGLRAADDPVEREGVARARARASSAALALVVVDASGGESVAREVSAALGGRPVSPALVVLTKRDLLPASELARSREAVARAPGSLPVLAVSALRGDGLDELVRSIVVALVGPCSPASLALGPVLFTPRQRDLVRSAREAIARGDLEAAGRALQETRSRRGA